VLTDENTRRLAFTRRLVIIAECAFPLIPGFALHVIVGNAELWLSGGRETMDRSLNSVMT
jgi:hypothetical protein